ncbi:caspase family protein [Streptomyces coelicoflavus]|uniref:caspase family protein n=1 Tax=Streptomyces coelicoflavus TaxID=285562 RepID=UPI0024AD40BD|nr:caspase family protein [Streptomyces coelicoflavus]MDI6516920.1 caspase family protein [Streptomyces coelicoflavus]
MTTASYPAGRSADLVRVALVSGTSTFRDGFEPLPRVVDELRMMRAVLAEAGFTIHHGSQTNPKTEDLERSFEKALEGDDGSPPDVLLFYYSGHGVDFGNGDVLLAAHDSKEAERSSMLDVAKLMSLIIPGTKARPRPGEVVILFDACRSGLAINRLGEEARKQGDKGTDLPLLTLLGSTDRTTDAQQMHFADSFAGALRNAHAGDDDEYLGAYRLFAELKYRMEKGSENPREPQLPSWVPPRDETRAFPNPRHNPRRPVRRPPEANDGSGWAFCGRAEGVRDVASHLVEAPPSEPGAPLVVTGRRGSGKSVLLDWIHVSSSQEHPLPTGTRAPSAAPGGCVDLLLDVRGQSVDVVVSKLARRFSRIDQEDSVGLVEALGDRGLRLVFDSVDASQEPELLYSTLLVPLAAQPRTRVVMATSEVPDGFAGRIVDLDADEYFHEADMVELVEQVLRNRKGTRWSTTSARSIRDIALATTAAAGRSWLRAYLFAVDTSTQDPATARVQAERSNADLFLDALERLSRDLDDDDPRWARDMLLPVALAQGHGLPADGRLWAAVVRAAGRPGAGLAAITDVCREARDYLDVPEDGMNSHGWRLTRPPTADYLAGSADARRYHALFVAAMTEQLSLLPSGQRDWSSADQYTREQLPHHARLAGILDEFLDDPEFLLAMNGEALYRTLGLMQKSTDDRVANVRALCWELMGSRWRPDGHTLARLALHAQVRALGELAQRARAFASGWKAVAVDCRPPYQRPKPEDRDLPEDRSVKTVHCLPDGGELALTGSSVFHRPGDADDTAWAVFNPDPEQVPSRKGVPPRITTSSVIDYKGRPALFVGDITGGAWVALLNRVGLEIPALDLHCPLNTCVKVGQDLLIVGSEGWHWRSARVTSERVDKPGLRLGGATAAVTADGVRVAARTAWEVVVWGGDGERLHTFEPPQKRGLVKITSDAHGIYTGAGDGSVWWSDWNGRTHRWVADHASGVSELRLCTVGHTQVLVSAGVHGDIRLSSPTGSGPAHHFDIGLDVHSVDLHRNGRILVGTAEGLVRITP